MEVKPQQQQKTTKSERPYHDHAAAHEPETRAQPIHPKSKQTPNRNNTAEKAHHA